GAPEGCITQVSTRKILSSWPRPTRVPHAARGVRPMYRHGSTPSRLTCREQRARPDEGWAASPDPATSAASDGDVRHDLVARVRREIEAGTYDTPERLEAALRRLFECLAAPAV